MPRARSSSRCRGHGGCGRGPGGRGLGRGGRGSGRGCGRGRGGRGRGLPNDFDGAVGHVDDDGVASLCGFRALCRHGKATGYGSAVYASEVLWEPKLQSLCSVLAFGVIVCRLPAAR